MLAVVVAMSSIAGSSSFATDEEPTSVVWIILDDVNLDLSIYGHPSVQTPNLDRIAARGVVFDAAYAPYPENHASRVATSWGLRPQRTQVYGPDDPQPQGTIEGIPPLATLFRDEGYFAGAYGRVFHRFDYGHEQWDEVREMSDDSHVSQPIDPAPQDPSNLYWGPFLNGADGSLGAMRDTYTTDFAIERLRKADNPRFLAIGYTASHEPWIYPEKFTGRYDPQNDVDALPPEETNGAWKNDVHPTAFESDHYLDPNYHTDPELGRRDATVAYWQTISYVDEEIGRILDEIEALGVSEKTVIVVMGDQGWSMGYHSRYDTDAAYDRSMRCPLIVSVPWLDETHGQRCARPIEMVDLYPTLAELCEIPAPAGLDGESLVPLLENPTLDWHPAFATVTKELQMQHEYMVTTDQYRFMYWHEGTHQLFDRSADAGEYYNLHGDPAYQNDVDSLTQALTQEGLLVANWTNIRHGLAGTLGIPELVCVGNPILGQTFRIDVGNSAGATTFALGIVGVEGDDLHAYGGVFVLIPNLVIPLGLATGGVSHDVDVPNDPLLMGVPVGVQVLMADPGAPYGVAFTRGLRVFFWDQ